MRQREMAFLLEIGGVCERDENSIQFFLGSYVVFYIFMSETHIIVFLLTNLSFAFVSMLFHK